MNDEEVMGETANEHYPSFSRRAGGYLIDGVLLSGLDGLVLFTAIGNLHSIPLMVVLVVSKTAVFLYRPVGHGGWGMTIGKRCGRMRVQRTDGRQLSFTRALLREALVLPGFLLGIAVLVMAIRHSPDIGNYLEYKSTVSSVYRESFPAFVSLSFGYSFIIMAVQIALVLRHPKHRALHDVIAGTVVVYTPKVNGTIEASPEEFTCLECGEVIPLDESTCPSCGWSYRGEIEG